MSEVSSPITVLQLISIPEASWNSMLQATLGTIASFKMLLELDKQLDVNILILMRKYVFHLKRQFGLEWNFVSKWWHGDRFPVLIPMNSAAWPVEAILTSALVAFFSHDIFPLSLVLFLDPYCPYMTLKLFSKCCIPVLYWLYPVEFTPKGAHAYMGVVILRPAGEKILCSHLLNLSSLSLLQPREMGRRVKVKLAGWEKNSLILKNKIKYNNNGKKY